jgi:coenzyme PQQ precursor peptide PqqA
LLIKPIWRPCLTDLGGKKYVEDLDLSSRAAAPTLLPFRHFRSNGFDKDKEESMAWTTPVLVEICIGLEINGYMPADGNVPPEF